MCSARHRLARGAGLGTVVLLFSGAFFVSAASALPIGCVKTGGVVECPQVSYRFQTLNDNADNTFNQLLGINQGGVIAGYFGSGAQGHPNKGYLLFPSYYQNYYGDNNFPGSLQTQVTGLNNGGVLVGFFSTMNNAGVNGAAPVDDNHAWYKLHGQFSAADFPTSDPANPPVDQLLGVNNKNVAVGFYTDGQGDNHGYTYKISTHSFGQVTVPKFTNITATGINDRGDIAGFGTSKGDTEAFLLANGKTTAINYPGSSQTQALGINNNDEVVGDYTVGSGNNATMHGFTWYPGFGFHKVDAPAGSDTTTINAVNECGDIVGFYVDGAGNTDGLLGSAQFSTFVSPGHSAQDASASAARTKKIKTKLPNGC
jgi:hypothetical protein